MRERGIREVLVVRVSEALRETRSKVKTRGDTEENFWMARRLRQGCSLSSIFFFSPLIADLKKKRESKMG